MKQRTLTHQLQYDEASDRWPCINCNFTLGDGHDQLYARCPRNGRTRTLPTLSRKRDKVNYLKPKRKTNPHSRRTRDLFGR